MANEMGDGTLVVRRVLVEVGPNWVGLSHSFFNGDNATVGPTAIACEQSLGHGKKEMEQSKPQRK